MRESLLDEVARHKQEAYREANVSQSRITGVLVSLAPNRKTAEVQIYGSEIIRRPVQPGTYEVGDIVVISVKPENGQPEQILYSTGEKYQVTIDSEDYITGNIGDGLVVDPRDDGIDPPTPEAPVLTNELGTVQAFVRLIEPPKDHSHFDIAAGREPNPEEIQGHIAGGEGSWTMGGFPYNKPVYVRARTVDVLGQWSPWSEQSQITPKPLVDEDVIIRRLDAAEVEITNANKILLETGKELGQRLEELGDVDLSELEDALDELRDTTLPALQGRLQEAEDILGPLPEVVEAAEASANAATQALQDAEQRMSDAEQAALDAAGVAAGKGQVITQISPPSGSRARVENLWVRLPDHKVHIYDESTAKWVAATDPDLIDAAQEAASAATAASEAKAAAAAAQADATQANDRAEVLEGQVGTLREDLDAAQVSLTTLRDETLPALDADLVTLRDTTIPDLQGIVGPLPDAVSAAQTAADNAQGRADDAHDELSTLAGTVADKSALHFGDDEPDDRNALWIRNGVPHIYVDHGDEAHTWANRDTGLANWTLSDSGGSAEYRNGVIHLDGYSARAESPVFPVDPALGRIGFRAVVKVVGRSPNREDEDRARVIFSYLWHDDEGGNRGTSPAQSASALYVDEGTWVVQGNSLNVNEWIAGFRLRITANSNWTGDQIWVAGVYITQDDAHAPFFFDGDSPGFQWDGERWASTSSYAGPGWYPVNDPEIRDAAARAQAARERADAAHDRADQLEGSVGTLQNDLATAADRIDTLRDTTLPALDGRLEDVEYDTRNFSAEWITAGTLDTARLNAREIGAAVGDFVELNADQITGGLIQGSQVNAESVAGRIGSFLRLNAEQIISGTIKAGQVDAESIGAAVGTFVDIAADQITAVGAGFNTAVANEMFVKIFTANKIGADEIAANSIGAAVGEFVDLRADQITAVGAGFKTAVIDEIWTEAVRAKLLTADEAIIGGAVIRENAISVRELDVTSQMTAALLQAKRIDAGDINANSLRSAIITAGSVDIDALDVDSIVGDAAFIRDITSEVITSNVFSGKTFIGGTFTGATFRTADSGRRLDLSSTQRNALRAWSGTLGSGEVPGGLTIEGGSNEAILTLSTPKRTSGDVGPSLVMDYSVGSWPTITLNATTVEIESASSQLRVDVISVDTIVGKNSDGVTLSGPLDSSGITFGSSVKARYSRWNTSKAGISRGTTQGAGTITQVSSTRVGQNPATIVGESLRIRETGIYTITYTLNTSSRPSSSSTRQFLEIAVTSVYTFRQAMGEEDWGQVSTGPYRIPGGTQVNFIHYVGGSGTYNISGRITIIRHD